MNEFLALIGKDPKDKLNLISDKLSECFEEDMFCCRYNMGFDLTTYEDDSLFVVLLGFLSFGSAFSGVSKSKKKCSASDVGRLYLTKSQEFYELIDGNFSLCIYDRKKKKTLFAKDKIGSRPLYFSRVRDFLFFSSSQRLLVENTFFDLSVNNETLARYLALQPIRGGDTFFTEINKLNPFSLIQVDNANGDFNEQQFRFKKRSDKTKRVLKDFQIKLEKAIERSWSNDSKVGVMFSGGLDSSAITVGLRDCGYEKIETFSCNFSHLPNSTRKLSDEADYQNFVTEKLGVTHNTIELAQSSPMDSLQKQFEFFAEPTHFPNLYIFESVADCIKSHGIEVLFDGQDGDNVISHGFERLREQLQHLNLIGFLCEVICYSRFNKIGLVRTISYFILETLKKWGLRKRKAINKSILQAEIYEKFYLSNDKSATAVDSHIEKINNPLHSVAFEAKYTFFKYYQLHVRSPFYEKELIEFCLSLPSRWKLNQGRSRFILRLYLIFKGLDIVGNRNKKANLSHGLSDNISRLDFKKIEYEINNIHASLKDFVDIFKLREYLTKVKEINTINDYELTSLLAFCTANLWLRHPISHRVKYKR